MTSAKVRACSLDINAAKQPLDDNGLVAGSGFLTALKAVLDVLPPSARYSGFRSGESRRTGRLRLEALESLRRLDLAEQLPAPSQLDLVLAKLAEAS